MINICPQGRNASDEERKEFEEYDKVTRKCVAKKQIYHIRETMISHLEKEFKYLGFQYLIGGQTSFDVVPKVFISVGKHF